MRRFSASAGRIWAHMRASRPRLRLMRPQIAAVSRNERSRLPTSLSACHLVRMFAIDALRRFLFLLTLLGIVFAPVYDGAAASVATCASDGHRCAAPAASDMADCCRGELPAQRGDCDGSCLLARAGFSIAFVCERQADWHFKRTPRTVLLRPLSDTPRPSALVEPPTQPPKA